MPDPVSRDAAWTLLTQWVDSPSLRRHCLSVEASMRAYAEKHATGTADEVRGRIELWGATGLLHDMDYEKHPDMTASDGHPRTALRVLEEEGYPPELIRAVASHADYMDVARETAMEKTLYAVDELSGFVVACAAIRPDGIRGMTPKSVKKKLKTPAFAAAVNRDEVREGAEQLGVDFDEHISTVIAALEARAEELDLTGSGERAA